MSLNEIPQDLPYNISALDISHNRLIKIAHQWLSPYRKLVDIDASFNSISKLDEQMCQVVPLLQILNMEKNQMLEPNTQELSHCINLVWLNMASNRLKLKGEPFAGIQSLKFLEVSKNNLMSAKLSMKPEILNLIYLGLSNNDITILKTGDLNFLRKSSLRVLNLSSVRLKTVEPGSFKHISSLQTLVLDEEDTSWVERKMLPLERHQCRFCLEDRDSIPGMSQLESIVDNIRRSRKLLFVVTDNLLNDPWCRRFIVHHALHQVIENSRDSVVLVLREDIHDHKLSRALFLRRGMLRPCCIVHWPPQRERLAAFHQNLLIALGKTNHWLQ
uniref:TIR domain-containing protein n=1 Tax=Knipowitschia caucasica TaxID=637954 RepID=A0AAV2LHF2_KNICA